MSSRDGFTRLGDGNVIAARFNEGRNRDLAIGLRSLAAALAGSEVAEHAQALLPHVIRQADRFGITRIAIADAGQVSEATVSRWASSQITPHVIMARAVIEEIRKIAQQNAVEYEAADSAKVRAR
jgi:hypothetical protein